MKKTQLFMHCGARIAEAATEEHNTDADPTCWWCWRSCQAAKHVAWAYHIKYSPFASTTRNPSTALGRACASSRQS